MTGANAMDAGAASAETLASGHDFEADRAAILSMAGEYEVTFDFTEVLPLEPGYELKEPKITPAREVVYVIEDRGDFISLQHLLLVGGESDPFVVKHWRQDWQYEPETQLSYVGSNSWDVVPVKAEARENAWSQTVYQVDDSPRYAATARWEHTPNAATWEPPVSWRPLPRRDATTREDYDTIAAVNRHTVAVCDGTPRALVREHGLNTYREADLAGDHAAAAYWEATQDYWAEVREAWDDIIAEGGRIVVDDDADGTRLFGFLLAEAQAIQDGEQTAEEAFANALPLMESQISVNGAPAELD